MELKGNILATLAYYDVFDFPLKAEEVFNYLINFKHLYQNDETAKLDTLSYLRIEMVKKELDQLILNKTINYREGYFFLNDREYLVPLRQKREKIAKHKWQITRRTVRWLGLLPYVRAIFASGSLAMSNTDELSDLDVLIVVKRDRIWLARFLILGLLAMLGVRRKGSDQIAPSKICSNHFITDKSLHIPLKSIYNAQTYSNLVPIYLTDRKLIDEFKKENSWVLDYVFNWSKINLEPIIKLGVARMVTGVFEKVLDFIVGNFLEKIVGNYQRQRIADNPITRQPNGRVVFSDEQLEFHPHSIEKKIITKYSQGLVSLGLSDVAVEKDSG